MPFMGFAAGAIHGMAMMVGAVPSTIGSPWGLGACQPVASMMAMIVVQVPIMEKKQVPIMEKKQVPIMEKKLSSSQPWSNTG
jgi:hypothetical protein